MSRTKVIVKILRLGRLHFILAGFFLFLMGATFALVSGAEFSGSKLLIGYLILFLAHLSVHYSNDYFDVDSDKFGQPTTFTGGTGVLVNNPQLRCFAKWFALFLMGSSITLAAFFTVIYSYPLWFMGYVIMGNLLGWFYAAPPLKLAYRGLGELSTIFTIGFLVPVMGYVVMAEHLTREFAVLLLPLLIYGIVFIISVQIPDLEADLLGNKKTIVSRKGRVFGFEAIGVLLFIASGYFFVLPAVYQSYLNFHFLGFFSLPFLSMGVWGLIKRPDKREKAVEIVNGNLKTLILFLMLTNIYFIYLLFS
ncbi:MAG: prenyltransferase [Archaeoglobaceae archaeon]